MRLYIKIMILYVLIIAVVVGLISFFVFANMNEAIENQMAGSARDLAVTIASMNKIKEELFNKTGYTEIQNLVESFRKKTRYQYIIVMDMDGIQYSYPYKSGLGKSYKNGGEEKVLSEGLTYSSADRNELISAIRAFAPVYYENEQVGAVLVGLLTDTVQLETKVNRRSLELILTISFIFAIIGAVLLSINIKKSIFGLEPKEIALLLTEKELILRSIRRGIVAIDLNGTILLYNDAARNLMELPDDAEGKSLRDYVPELTNFLLNEMKGKGKIVDLQVTLNANKRLIINSCFMENANEEVVGVVASIEDFSQVRKLAEELTDYKGMVDSLRSQNHEFMNKLHTLSGLIQLEAYDEALDYIDSVSKSNQKLQHILLTKIKDQKVAGLLLAKHNCLSEARIDLSIDTKSLLEGFPNGLDAEGMCSIIGNLIDNSRDALKGVTDGKIQLYIFSSKDECEIVLRNNGPEIEEDSHEKLLQKGYSTKSNTRGMGLYLVNELVKASGGSIRWHNDKGVVWHVRIKRK